MKVFGNVWTLKEIESNYKKFIKELSLVLEGKNVGSAINKYYNELP